MSQQQQRNSRSKAPQTNLYSTAVNLSEESRVPVIQTLNQALADTTDLQSQAKFAHWNVKGREFFQLHLLFDEIAETLSEHVDLLAERVTALGGQAMGTTRIAAKTSRIPEPPVEAVDDVEYIEWRADPGGHHASFLRDAIEQAAKLGDEDTADLFTEISREVDTQLYFLESHLQTEVRNQVPATMSQPQGSQSQGAGQMIGGQQGGSRSMSGSESGRSQIEIQGGAPQAMAPTQGMGQSQGIPQDVSSPISAPQGLPQDVAQPIQSTQGSLQGGSGQFRQQPQSFRPQQQGSIPPQQAQGPLPPQQQSSGQSQQGQGSLPPQQQSPSQPPQQSQGSMPPQQRGQQQPRQQQPRQQQGSQQPRRQQGSFQSPQHQQSPPRQQQRPFPSEQQGSLPPQQQSQIPPQQQGSVQPPQGQGFEQQQPMSQPTDIHGGAPAYGAASSALQDFPTRPGP
jgi:starvation-inducible DNA-binding protein